MTSPSSIKRAVDNLRRATEWAISKRGATVIVVAITVFGLGLRLWNLDHEPLHVDELLQVTQVQQPWGDVIRSSYEIDQPPVDYLIGKLVITIAPANDFTQRLPAALFGTGAVGLVGLLLLRERQHLAAIVASFFVAISPLSILLAQYARPYALPTFAVLATIAVYQHWHRGARNRRTMVLFVVIASVTVLTRAVMPLVALAAIGALGLARALATIPPTRPLRLVRSDPPALIALPLVFLFVWVPNAMLMVGGGVLVDCWRCDQWERLGQGVVNFGEFGEEAIRPTSLVLLLFIGIVVLIAPAVRTALRRTAVIWAPLLAAAVGFTLWHAMALPPGTFFATRYLAFLPVGLIVYLSIVAAAIVGSVRAAHWITRSGVLALMLVFAVMTTVPMLDRVRYEATGRNVADWRSTAEYIESIETPGDVIVAIDTRPLSPETKFGFEASPRYYHGDSPSVTPAETVADPTLALGADRFHFVLFVPKLIEQWEIPDGWDYRPLTEIVVLTTNQLTTDAERLDAWWDLTRLLRFDVAIHTQIAGEAMQQHAGIALHPWADTAVASAAVIGQESYARSLLDLARSDD